MPLQAKAIRIEQRGRPMYVTALKLQQLAPYVQVDEWSPESPEGYQRPLRSDRLRALGRFLTYGQNLLPTSLLLCWRDDAPLTPQFTVEESSDDVQMGTLTVPDATPLWLVDGQHRFFAAQKAAESGALTLLEFSFPVVILEGLNRYEEMLQFHTINTEDKRVPSDIADRHLVQRLIHEGQKGLLGERGGEKRVVQAVATLVADYLNHEEGVWQGQIKIPGVKGRTEGLVKQHALVFSLEPVLRDAFLGSLDHEELAHQVNNYWAAYRDIWPEAFEEPKQHRIQASAGIYSLHMLMPTVVQVALAVGGRAVRLTVQSYLDVLEPLRQMAKDYADAHGAGFWAKRGGHDLTVAVGLGAHRRLAALLRSYLPSIAVEEEKVAVRAEAPVAPPLAPHLAPQRAGRRRKTA